MSFYVECDHEGWPDGHSAFKTYDTFWGILMGQLKKYEETGQAEPAFRGESSRESSQRKHVARG